MSQTKRALKGKRPSKALSVLGVAGVSWAASAGGSVADIPSHDTAPFQVFTLGDEEISDVSLATFHAFDKESLGTQHLGIQVARACCAGCGRGCGGCGGRGCGGWGRGCAGWGGRACVVRGCARGCGWGWGGCGGWGWGWGGCCLSWGGCSPWC